MLLQEKIEALREEADEIAGLAVDELPKEAEKLPPRTDTKT